eukprot:1861166-Prymnesium_polylepis.1
MKLKEVIQEGAASCRVALSPHFVLLQKSFYVAKMKHLVAEWALVWYLEQDGVPQALKLATSQIPEAAARVLEQEVGGKSRLHRALTSYLTGDREANVGGDLQITVPAEGRE